MAKTITAKVGLSQAALRSGARHREVVQARRVVCQAAVKHMRYSGAAVARFLGVITSSVNRLAATEELPEGTKLMKML